MKESGEMGSIVKTSTKSIWQRTKSILKFLAEMVFYWCVGAYIVILYYELVYITVKFVESAMK